MNTCQTMLCKVMVAVLIISCFSYTAFAASPLAQMIALGIVTQTDSSSSTPAASQQGSDVVYLKDGEVIRGVILEETPAISSLKIRVMNNNVLTFIYSDINKIVYAAAGGQSAATTPQENAAAPATPAAVTAMAPAKDSGSLIIKQGWLLSKYYHDGIQIKNGDDWKAIYSNNPHAYSEYDASRAWAVPCYICEGAACLFECIALIDNVSAASSSNLSQMSNSSDQGVGLMIIGVGCLVVAVPFAIIARVHFSDAIDIYNGAALGHHESKVSLEATHNGIGLCLRF